jgi:1,4-dihydroxy-2-naphthoate octaprenyltransferase
MKHWIQAARLRTLPLSISGIILGSFYALAYPTDTVLTPTEIFNWKIFVLALITTLGLQVLSNFANDYGDGIKGTDNEDRIGPKRALQSGVITPNQMKKAIIITSIATLLAAILLIYVAFGNKNFIYSVLFLLLGVFAISSAIRYTVGNSAYGYKGYGDLFVFIFFGLVSTIGVNFLYSKQLDWILFLPAIAIGFLSVGVLNLNNMRDELSDRKANKNTIVVKIGGEKAKIYHFFLITTAMVLIVVFAIIKKFNFDQYLFLIVYLPLIKHLKTVYNNTNPADLDPELKKVALSTFALAMLISLCMIFFLSDIFVNNG